MKKKLNLLFLFLLCLCAALSACENGKTEKYITIRYFYQGTEYGTQKFLTTDTTAPEPICFDETVTGYTFGGWFFSTDGGNTFGDEYTGSVKPDVNIDVYCRMVPVTYCLNLFSNYAFATDTMSTQTVAYDELTGINQNAFSRAGYTIKGWAGTTDGEMLYTAGENVINLADSDGAVINLYALWQRDPSKSIINFYKATQKLGEKEVSINTAFVSLRKYSDNDEAEIWADSNGLICDSSTIISGGEFSAYLMYTVSSSGELACHMFAENMVVPAMAEDYKIITLKNSAFKDAAELKSIVLPSNLRYIKEKAFSGCTKLESVCFDDASELLHIESEAFYNCVSLTEMLVPNSVQSIGAGAFACEMSVLTSGVLRLYASSSLLERLVVPFVGGAADANTFIAYIFGGGIEDNWFSATGSAINGESGLFHIKSCLPLDLSIIEITGNVTKLPDFAFFGCTFIDTVILSDSVVEIGESAFENCMFIENVNLSNIKKYGDSAFYNSGISAVDFSKAEEIGDNAFQYTYIDTLNFTNNLKKIGYMSFALTEIESIIIPSSIEIIDSYAFLMCENLVEAEFKSAFAFDPGIFYFYDNGEFYISGIYIYLPESNKPYLSFRESTYYINYASHIFPVSAKGKSGVIMDGDTVIGYIGMAETIKITQGKHISIHAFSNRPELKYLILPEGLETIDGHAFYDCVSLTNTRFPSTLKKIDDFAFASSSSDVAANQMTRVELPEGFVHLGKGAFLTNFLIQYIYIPSTIEYMGYLCFGASSGLLKIYLMAEEIPEIGTYDTSEGIDIAIFAYVNGGKTKIIVPSGLNADRRSYASLYRNHAAFYKFSEYIIPFTQGDEYGTYSSANLSIALDGGDCFDLILLDGLNPTILTGRYVLEGSSLTLIFADDSEITANFTDGVITIEYEGVEYQLATPELYYDFFNWTYLSLSNDGTGLFEMAGTYFIPFTYEIEGTVFKIWIDGNNKTLIGYTGICLYEGNIDENGFISFGFYLNDWPELMEFTFEPITEEAETPPEGLDGTYLSYNNESIYLTLVLNVNGTGTVNIGSTPYACTYTSNGSTLTIRITLGGQTYTLEILPDGNLYGDIFNAGLGDLIYYKQPK